MIGSTMSVRSSEARAWLPRGAALSTSVSFAAAASIAFLAFAANTAASPLYRVYQDELGFSATTLTLLFAVYIVVLLVTLLFLGSLSDYVGRRPMMLAGLCVGAVACGLFLSAHGLGLLFAARALQGVAVGLISGAASAALHDLRPDGGVAPLVASAMPTGGQAAGAVGASVLAQYAPLPSHLVWWLLLGAFLIGMVAVLAMPEPGTQRSGGAGSMRPHVGLPREARRAFLDAVPAMVGLWALAGLYLSLGPSLAGQLLHSKNLVWGGVLIFLLTGLGAAASVALVRKNPTDVMLVGCVVLIVGALVTFASIETSTPALLFAGTAVAGVGFGPAFMGAYRSMVAEAPPKERAGLITTIYIVGYLSTGIPAVIGGVAATYYGLHDTALVYSVVVAALVAVAVALLIRPPAAARAPRAGDLPAPPLGPGTVPPCPPIMAHSH